MIYIVTNDYQGVHFVASSRENAEKYVENICKTAAQGGCWVLDAFHIIEQGLDAPPEWNEEHD